MWHLFKRHFPYAAAVLLVLPLLLGEGALFILTLALAIGLMPLAYGDEVDEIVERTFDTDRPDH